MEKYLNASRYIDWCDSKTSACAKNLASGKNTTENIIEACFEFVRDEIKHTGDYKIDQITCHASDVLKHKTGYCYAKSHLLAALLRANNIPAGLVYQRQLLDREKRSFCLHGLNAVFLDNFGWFRLDARGNKEGIETSFEPLIESFAFDTDEEGEFIFSEIYTEPLQLVVGVLERCSTYREVDENLPDALNEHSI